MSVGIATSRRRPDPVASMLAPTSEAQLSAMVVEAARLMTPLEIVGGRTRGIGGQLPGARAMLSTLSMTGITLYEPAALTISARAGTQLSELEAALSAENQHLPFEPSDWRGVLGTFGESTVGGMFATGAAGPRRIQAGSVRDSAIGVRFVDGSGAIAKSGGRVMKNVTGYDLVKLMCGSHGTLGVLTEITFKVLPKPETSKTVVVERLDAARAVEALSAALTSPFDVTGAAHAGQGADARTYVRVEGFERSVAYRAGEIASLLKPFGTASIISLPTESRRIWQSIRDVKPFSGRQGAVWKVSLRPSSAPALVAAVRDSVGAEALLDWGGGLVWLMVPGCEDDGIAAVRAEVARLGGHATLMRPWVQAPVRLPFFQPQAPAIEALSSRLRRQFDPNSILNPGRMQAATGQAGG
jgi:glycolate oxidase FAD binding subunit